MAEYTGNYDKNFATTIARLVRLHMESDEHFTAEDAAHNLERHAERLRENPPTFEDDPVTL